MQNAKCILAENYVANLLATLSLPGSYILVD